MKIPSIITKHKLKASLVVAVLIAGSVYAAQNNGSDKAPEFKEAAAIKGDVGVFFEADGLVEAEKAAVNFAQSGVLKEIKVKVGDKINAGDALAVQDTSKLQSQVDQAWATYNINSSKLARLNPDTGEEVLIKKQVLDAARIALDAERAIYSDVLAKNGLGSSQEISEAAKLKKAESDLESTQAQLNLTLATYKDAEYGVNSAWANVLAAKNSLADAYLKATITGTITGIEGIVGQTVGGSQQSSSAFITISKTNALSLSSYLDEEDITKVKTGQQIEAEFSSLEKTVKGAVSYVSPVAKTDQNGAVSYQVKMNLENTEAAILDGMSANIKFITKKVGPVVKVPNSAVKQVDGKTVVSMYDGSKNIITKEVETGFTDGKDVEIKNGLGAGEKVLIKATK
ncbi:MAG: Efflux transporter, RND family, MFP subunit [candidate division CPR2 bacterium GW2011_GWC1_39_9]|uniref:Efflux transporter, RND family, MFP subunit n=1 Tax=candidate division CPR2 bacterium GW2011_GWC2_39_10 TaxID=1618345 RepID=A0A0G0P9A7_UNCC2|nr:MAG: Efflux transporter, RND family, MFP subunit [candidate division CPR2 bacterium GW2011_GWC2_39_10]KKR32863.1 MAG: Efflux transporter, RND family, MFP subunit [candidate division CPR2 bacterium GW2011_GWC1_39_9]